MKNRASPAALVPTNAASSGVEIDKKRLKQLIRRTDRDGLIWMTGCLGLLTGTGYLLGWSMQTNLFVPMLIIYSGILATSGYALSHECAHGTAFRTRWINESLFRISSFIYGEEHYFRRYTHASHHTYTYHQGLDAQVPFKAPLTFLSWLYAMSGLEFLIAELATMVKNATGNFAQLTLDCTPDSELSKLKWNARIYLTLYVGIGIAIFYGAEFLLWYFVLPRLIGQPVMGFIVILQHLEMTENQMDIRESTRSFSTNVFIRFIYMNMNYHVEHHLYPTVPFHALAGLNAEIKSQLPDPDPGLFRTNWWGLKTVIRRSLGKTPMINLARTVAIK